LVGFRSVLEVFINEVAYDATDAGGAAGKVWSDTRLNRREVTTRMRVATFSGESRRALRTLRSRQLRTYNKTQDALS
jgi:hypothetical protein